MAKIDHISYGGTNYEIVPAAGDLRDIVAPEFSDQNTYTAGQTVLKNGVLYRFTADHTGAWTGSDAETVTVVGEVEELERITSDWSINLTASDFTQGVWNRNGTSGTSSRQIRTKTGIPVHVGDKIITKASSLWICWHVMDDQNNIVEEYYRTSSYYKWQITDREYTFTHSGTLYITVANGINYGNSSNIVPADMTATIDVYNNKLALLAYEVGTFSDSIEDLYSETRELKLNEDPTTTTASKFFYYPMDFVPGQTYIVKIKFSAFTSSANRKYSLRTTKGLYTSSAYQIQMIAQVDGSDPQIGVEYTYKFTAIAKENGDTGKYLAVELNPTTGEEATANVKAYSIRVEDTQTELDKLDYITATDIVSLNHNIPYLIANGNKPLSGSTNPFKLLHFSDIHASQTNLERLVELKESLGNAVDDTICTGDMVSNNYSETCMDFWDAVEGSESILMIVGNHELADGSHGYSSDQIGQTVAYQKYFSPYVSNWGVTMAGENLTYWYKDYASRKVRLIGINYLLTGDAMTAQNAWLTERLTEAKTNNYAVVIAVHTPPSAYTRIDCNFAEIGIGWTYNEMPTSIQDVVETFIDGGGEFACYIGGHAHRDLFGYNSNYPNQIFIDITTAMTTGSNNDQYRANGTKSQDAANIFMVDTVTKTIKLIRVGADMDCYLRGRHLMSINYNTKTVIANS